jgi:predicted RNA binding protein YcfA (HicA-like mRNA interferase family)
MPRITPVHWHRLERIFLAAGFRFVRQRGSHRAYVKQGLSRPVIIPTYEEVPVAIIRNNLKTAGHFQRGILQTARELLRSAQLKCHPTFPSRVFSLFRLPRLPYEMRSDAIFHRGEMFTPLNAPASLFNWGRCYPISPGPAP